ncbi:ribose transport protein RbsD [Orenia metallireducens]|jgi:D-ribose pyranase|uniref:D-ribose pyranase n=1 Tax=Orenia metallireducens TaxID=1413210 RepID=A0A285H9G5_9FIRM|nr:D-ribose pyranase [Orenia metallireducens]PRX28890.1 ribose transport protein RbsD [Orenia metallireducens]SNY32368.1 ribose transport protein RbsD [Orenia metallireducens]
MKKRGILNVPISKTIAELGHTDKLVICDAGLPIPQDANRIDLALKAGTPNFINVLKPILDEMVVEKAILAEEIKQVSPELFEEIKEALGDIAIEFSTHEEFKKLSQQSKGIVRTGEITSYANIILVSGVDF